MQSKNTRTGATRFPPSVLALLLAAAGGAVALYGVALMSDDAGWMNLLNASLPALLGGTCLWAGYRLVRKQPAAVWAPLPWFLAAWTAYYGFGPLAYVYGTPETVAYMDAFLLIPMTSCTYMKSFGMYSSV